MNTNAGRLKVGVVTKAPTAVWFWFGRFHLLKLVDKIRGSSLDVRRAAFFIATGARGKYTQQGRSGSEPSQSAPPTRACRVPWSADGNTAIVGGPYDNSQAGAAWMHTRSSSGAWSQQGSKLVGTGAIAGSPPPQQGYSVAISGDGNTAIVGGPVAITRTSARRGSTPAAGAV